MKYLKIILLFALFATIGSYISACEPGVKDVKDKTKLSLPDYFYKRLEGSINGKLNIVMNLSRNDSMLTGNYYYKNNGTPIFFSFDSRIASNGSVKIGERTGKYDKNYNEIVSGEFTGKFIGNHELKGEWKKPGTDIAYKFTLKETYPAESAAFVIKRTSRQYQGIDSSGASIEYIFPQITGNNSASSDTINNSIVHNLIAGYQYGDRKKDWNNFDEEMSDFINKFKTFEKESSLRNGYMPSWANSFVTSVIFNSDNILVLEKIDYRYEGGAHPNTYFTFYNYNLKTGRLITLPQIFSDGYKDKLDKIGERIFREKYNIKPDQDLEKAGYFLTDHKFQLNDNFAIYKGGLLFKFNPYEIAAYVYGAPEVCIPFSDLKDLIKDKKLLPQ